MMFYLIRLRIKLRYLIHLPQIVFYCCMEKLAIIFGRNDYALTFAISGYQFMHGTYSRSQITTLSSSLLISHLKHYISDTDGKYCIDFIIRRMLVNKDTFDRYYSRLHTYDAKHILDTLFDIGDVGDTEYDNLMDRNHEVYDKVNRKLLSIGLPTIDVSNLN